MCSKPVVLAYDAGAVLDDADDASRDVLDQLDAVESAVLRLSGRPVRYAMPADLARARADLARLDPALVFNLVESLAGSDRLQTAAALLFEDMNLPFTGSGPVAMALANHKLAAKARLAERGIPVPATAGPDAGPERRDWIVKALASHASVFLDDAMVLRDVDAATAADAARDATAARGQAFFAEAYIEGREFNLSLLAGEGGGPEVLPPAEIRFEDWDPARPRIVGYEAKWHEATESYARSVRHFDFPDRDAPLLARLGETAAAVWQALGLAGYARVDFRVGGGGSIHVLEANANPCLTPGAGFAAAAERAGLPYPQMVERITRAAKIFPFS